MIREIEIKKPNTTGLVTTVAFNTTATEIENRMPDSTNLATKLLSIQGYKNRG